MSLFIEAGHQDGETIRKARWKSGRETWMRTIDSALTARAIARVVRKVRSSDEQIIRVYILCMSYAFLCGTERTKRDRSREGKGRENYPKVSYSPLTTINWTDVGVE
jgi:hypothetical protein